MPPKCEAAAGAGVRNTSSPRDMLTSPQIRFLGGLGSPTTADEAQILSVWTSQNSGELPVLSRTGTKLQVGFHQALPVRRGAVASETETGQGASREDFQEPLG